MTHLSNSVVSWWLVPRMVPRSSVETVLETTTVCSSHRGCMTRSRGTQK